jgi:hypothetical protein
MQPDYSPYSTNQKVQFQFKHDTDHVDPEPFTVAMGIVGIVGAVASAIAAYRSLAPNQLLHQRRKLGVALGEVDDLLRYLETDIQLFRDLLQRADISGQRRFRLGSRAFFNIHDFDRYAKLTDNMFGRLRKLLSCTHSIERAFTRIDRFPELEPVRWLDNIQGMIRRLLQDGDQTVDEALDSLKTLISMTRQMVQELERTMAFKA